MINSLEEAIKHCEEVAEEQDKLATRYEDASGYSRTHIESLRTNESIKCRECAEEHRQLAEWLRKLKAYEDRQDLINKNWQELINYKEGIEKIKMRSQMYRELGESTLASGMEQAIDILREVQNNGKQS